MKLVIRIRILKQQLISKVSWAISPSMSRRRRLELPRLKPLVTMQLEGTIETDLVNYYKATRWLAESTWQLKTSIKQEIIYYRIINLDRVNHPSLKLIIHLKNMFPVRKYIVKIWMWWKEGTNLTTIVWNHQTQGILPSARLI